MIEKKIRLSYIQIFFILSIILTFLPNGLIYRSNHVAQLIHIIYIAQFIIYIVTILLCIRKGFDLVTAPIISYIIWGVILLFSTFKYSKDITRMFRSVVYLLGILTIFFAVKYMFKYKNQKLFSTIYVLFTFFSCVNFITVIVAPNGLYNQGWQGATYWFGGKFITFYMFYTWLCLYVIRKQKRRIIAFLFPFMIGIYICIRVNCSTSIACIFISAILIACRKIVIKVKPWMLITIVLVITCIMIFSNVLFNNSFVQYFVTNVLHRSSMMTGRVEIYSSFLKIMRSDIWLGQGYDNSIIMRNTRLGYLNAQNGILDVITQTGLIGLIPYIFMLYSFWKDGSTYFNNIENQLVAVFLMGFFFCSFAEISFNSYFFLLIALISGDLSSITKKKRTLFLKK